ncbi:polysaccharide deacetylase family protein [Acidisoma cellulosilytica]|uniref:Chitooligosaccharide deacetylase n=1 Tax=Acidisoma cellulosilyticum TaxID=2802395 RepID=A0A964E6K5_9PROT|nr:polysaccharide deacetylase family protein [Acidisoma cellulosilyticum]MCB8883113.1 polysaccharide deacetylase family protein [Acidisoma cellulosilyticum]
MQDSLVYPRDLLGYAGQPPDPLWPGGALIAVSIVLNVEEGGEYNILHGDAHAEYVLTDAGVSTPLLAARDANVESMFGYGSRAGFWRVMRLLREREVQATIYAVGMALERNPAAAVEIKASGFDTVCHGYRWIDYHTVDEATERAHIARNVSAITAAIGRPPIGWYTGRPSPNTRRLVADHGGFLYDCDAYDDDLPYWTAMAGKPHLILPYSLDNNDARLVRGGDFATGDDFFTYCRDAFDCLYREGEAGRPRMMSIGLHSRIIGRPGRIGGLARLLDHIQRHDGVWLAGRDAIARHWIAQHPPTPAA